MCYVYWVYWVLLANTRIESSHCFQKCNKNTGCRILYNCLLKILRRRLHFHLHQLFTVDEFFSGKYLQLLTTKGDDGDCLILNAIVLTLFVFLWLEMSLFCISLSGWTNSIDTLKVFLCRLWASGNDIGLFEDHQIGSHPSTNCSVIVSTMSFNVVALRLPCNNLREEKFCRRNPGCSISGILHRSMILCSWSSKNICSSPPSTSDAAKIVFLCSWSSKNICGSPPGTSDAAKIVFLCSWSSKNVCSSPPSTSDAAKIVFLCSWSSKEHL